MKRWKKLKRAIAERKLVIISQDKVRNIPISSAVQLAGLAVVFFIVGWTAYATGIYFAYDHVIVTKDKRLAEIVDKHVTLAQQYAVLQRDLMRMAEAPADKRTQYENFYLEQYATTEGEAAPVDGRDALAKRISYLEDRLAFMENYKQTFLDTLGERTTLKVDELKKVISMTGMSLPDFKELKRFQESKKQPAPEEKEDLSRQGGPFIDYNSETAKTIDPDVMDGLVELSLLTEVVEALPLSPPVNAGYISSRFGSRVDPLNHRRAVHYGMDYASPYGTPIYSTAPGKIIWADRKGAYGKLVQINHGNGIETRYGHLQKILVRNGQEVTKGQAIGIQGNTGRSTGSHLHYEIRYRGKPINPEKFIKAGRSYVRQETKQQASAK